MSQLSYWGRPWAVFDPANKQHRCWFTQFQRSRTWGHCPIRFVITDESGDLITAIQRQLIDYYINKEFKQTNESITVKTKTRRKLRKTHLSA